MVEYFFENKRNCILKIIVIQKQKLRESCLHCMISLHFPIFYLVILNTFLKSYFCIKQDVFPQHKGNCHAVKQMILYENSGNISLTRLIKTLSEENRSLSVPKGFILRYLKLLCYYYIIEYIHIIWIVHVLFFQRDPR